MTYDASAPAKELLTGRTFPGTLFGTMGLRQDIRPVTYLKTRAAQLLSQVNESHRPVVITQKGEPKAVLQDPESYEAMRAALGMLKLLALGEADVRAGRVSAQDQVFARLRERLRRMKRRGGA